MIVHFLTKYQSYRKRNKSRHKKNSNKKRYIQINKPIKRTIRFIRKRKIKRNRYFI